MFSELTGLLDDPEGEETFYQLADTPLEAVVAMSKYVSYRAIGLIPEAAFNTLSAALHKAMFAADTSKGFNVAGVTYYVRELTQDQLEGLINLNKADTPSAA